MTDPSGANDARRSSTARSIQTAVSDADYRRLLELRSGLRQFLRWSESQARRAGLSSAQHQLLLAIKGHPGPRRPTIGEVAQYLALKHHSAVGLIDRAEAAHLIIRHHDPDDRRVTRLALTADAEDRLARVSAGHVGELFRLSAQMQAVCREWSGHPRGGPSQTRTAPRQRR